MLFDSHCHLTADAFDDDRELVLARARDVGVRGMVTIASDADDAEAALAWAAQHDGVWSTAGVHPHAAERATPEALRRVRDLLDHPSVVAVGECGLDFHYDNAPRDAQFAAFRAQIRMAGETGLSLVVHSRDADVEMIRELRGDAGAVTGVLHCFTGGDALLDAALEADWYVSFSGIATFKRYEGGDQVRRVPADRLLVETDSPYLAPVPHRGRRNEPAFVAHTAAVVAEMRGLEVDELSELTRRNAHRFYGLPHPTSSP
ncbi:TatD family hydrolase [Gemmatimonadota bacterium Y43]|uniref:TatD family hydrolase n=1 Tax=Gaopeijia maritima TaxID=3119007 RepID=UPI0032856772